MFLIILNFKFMKAGYFDAKTKMLERVIKKQPLFGILDFIT